MPTSVLLEISWLTVLLQDVFYYSLVYDATQKTLLADKGEIRVGEKYQCPVSKNVLTEDERTKDRADTLDTCVFRPDNGLTDRDIDQFLIVARYASTVFISLSLL